MSSEEKIDNPSNQSAQGFPRLVVEGNIPVLYKGIWVKNIVWDRDEITIGVMDPENDIYPDINLRQYRLDGGDPYISRRHACFLRRDGSYYVKDICKNNSTSVDNKNRIINGEEVEITHGSRIFISESIAFQFDTAPYDGKAEEEQPPVLEPSGAGLYYLEVEGEIPLFFKPRNIFTHIIELNPAEWPIDPKDGKRAILIGRRSTEDCVYPDIDLWKFYFNEGDEYVGRRHARIYEEEGNLYFQDLSGKGSTWYDVRDNDHRLVRTDTDPAIHLIENGNKLIVSDHAVFSVHKQEN